MPENSSKKRKDIFIHANISFATGLKEKGIPSKSQMM
tara:strand:+ start:196 stop:306 length:111 start_codon:yes stop_codon:yes gene_type:complete